jgi:cytochrome c oxidase subunit 2
MSEMGNTSLSLTLPSMLRPAAREADAVAEVAWVLMIGAALVFAITMALLVRALRPGARGPSAVWWIWGAGLVWPITVLTALGIYGATRARMLSAPPDAAPHVVGVTGHMWWWDVRVTDPDTGQPLRLANEIHIPSGQPVQIGLASADVIHSFWVPELGGKVDMVPGRILPWRVHATRPGVYRGQCAEYCGTQHARMALYVVVREPEQHARWLAHERLPASTPREPLALRGQQAFMSQGCAACHAVRGLTEAGQLGPDLTHVASRLTLGAGVLRNQPGAMAAWISGVQSLKSSAHMPAFTDLDADTLSALGAYLSQLR